MKKLIPMLLVIMLAGSASWAKIVKGPYIQNGGTDTVTICWESDRSIPATVAVAEKGGALNSKNIKDTGKFHEVVFNGLKPGRVYEYYVEEEKGAPEKGSFRTFPASPEPFRFVAFGDTRSQHDIHRKLVNLIMKYKPAFVLNSGDLVADGTKQPDWDAFWDITAPLARNIFYYPSLGNHEKDSALYYKYFALPENGNKERYYSFRYGNIFFAAMDSNMPWFVLAEQKSWLKDQLRNAQDADFRIVFYHQPFYTSSKRDPVTNFRQIYEPIFGKYNVQMSLNGHDHFYERSIAKNGVYHVVTGGGGAPLYDHEKIKPESIVRHKKHHFMIFDVEGKKMKATVIDIDDKVIDSFELSAFSTSRTDK